MNVLTFHFGPLKFFLDFWLHKSFTLLLLVHTFKTTHVYHLKF